MLISQSTESLENRLFDKIASNQMSIRMILHVVIFLNFDSEVATFLRDEGRVDFETSVAVLSLRSITICWLPISLLLPHLNWPSDFGIHF